MTDACYDTHVIPFDENDSAAFNSRAANLSASVVELANAYYANSAFSINTGDTSVMDLNHKKLSQYSDWSIRSTENLAFLTPTLAAWPLLGNTALNSILWGTLFLDQLHDFSLLS